MFGSHCALATDPEKAPVHWQYTTSTGVNEFLSLMVAFFRTLIVGYADMPQFFTKCHILLLGPR